jgi:Secretion system C-terminal sorting domain
MVNSRPIGYGSLAAGFLAITPQAKGQVSYVDVDPDEVLDQAAFFIDFDNDGTNDVVIGQFGQVDQFARIELQSDGRMLATNSSGAPYMYAQVLQAGDPVGPGGNFGQGNVNVLASFYPASTSSSNPSVFGEWLDQSGFLGLRFVAGSGDTHYAWVELTVGDSAQVVTVLGHAFEATPNVTIAAGDMGETGLSVEASGPMVLALYPQPAARTLNIGLSPGTTGRLEFIVRDVTGKVVLNEQRSANGTTIELDVTGLVSGAYLLEVYNGERRHVQRFHRL